VDGDTVIVDGERVRLIGIDAPESVKPDSPVECFGPEASAELKQLLPRRTPVLLEYDLDREDQYGRTLAYVWLTDPPRLINAELVRDGYATVATYRPNVAHLEELQAAEDTARAAERGLWSTCS
jgi:micrococcal nuclease